MHYAKRCQHLSQDGRDELLEHHSHGLRPEHRHDSFAPIGLLDLDNLLPTKTVSKLPPWSTITTPMTCSYVEASDFRNSFREELRKATNGDLTAETKTDAELKKRHSEVMRQQDQLLNLRLLEEINADTFACKAMALRDEAATLRLQIEAMERSHNETIYLAIKAIEPSQNLRAKWFAADVSAKRRILEIIFLNWTLDGVTLVPQMRKPFDQVAQGFQEEDSRGDRTPV